MSQKGFRLHFTIGHFCVNEILSMRTQTVQLHYEGKLTSAKVAKLLCVNTSSKAKYLAFDLLFFFAPSWTCLVS